MPQPFDPTRQFWIVAGSTELDSMVLSEAEGELTLENALATARTWADEGHDDVYILECRAVKVVRQPPIEIEDIEPAP